MSNQFGEGERDQLKSEDGKRRVGRPLKGEELSEGEREKRLKAISPDKLTTRHRQLMKCLVAGMTQGEAARVCDFSPVRVSQLVHSPLFASELERLRVKVDEVFVEAEGVKHVRSGVRQLLDEEALPSVKTLIGLRDDKEQSGQVRSRTAMDILDRSGHKAATEVIATVDLEASPALINMLGQVMKDEGAAKQVEDEDEVKAETD